MFQLWRTTYKLNIGKQETMQIQMKVVGSRWTKTQGVNAICEKSNLEKQL